MPLSPASLPAEQARLAVAHGSELLCSVQMYDVQGSLQKDSQVTVSIVLENQSSSFLKNMELSVLDSLNTKLDRPEGSSVHDGVPVPFQLPPGERACRARQGAWGGGLGGAKLASTACPLRAAPSLSPAARGTRPLFVAGHHEPAVGGVVNPRRSPHLLLSPVPWD